MSALQNADALLIRAWTHNRPPTTAAAYRRDAASMLTHAGKPLADLTLADLQAWHDSMTDDAPASRARRLSAARSLFKFAVEMGAIAVDPSRGLRAGKVVSQAPERIVTVEAMRRLIAAEPDTRRRTALRLLYETGLRASEAASLRWSDMTGKPKDGGTIRVIGKGSKERRVRIEGMLWRELLELHATPPRPDAPVLCGRDGQALDRFALHRLVKRAAKRVGLPDVSSHWFRHAAASHALDRGKAIQVVQQQLGHSSLSTTSRYCHVRPGEGLGSSLAD